MIQESNIPLRVLYHWCGTNDRSVVARREGLCLVTDGELRAWMRPESGYGRRFEFAGVIASIESLSRAWILQRGYNLRIGREVTVEAEFPGWFRHNRMDIRVQGDLSQAEVAFVALALLTAGPSS